MSKRRGRLSLKIKKTNLYISRLYIFPITIPLFISLHTHKINQYEYMLSQQEKSSKVKMKIFLLSCSAHVQNMLSGKFQRGILRCVLHHPSSKHLKKERQQSWRLDNMAIFSLQLLATTVFFALFLHRLLSSSHRGLPLPPGSRGWPVLGNLPQLGGKPHQKLAALSRKHGPLFNLRFGNVHVVVASSSSTASSFHKTHDTISSNRPPNADAEHVAYNYGDMVFASFGPRWRALRKICGVHLFSVKILNEFWHVREEETVAMVRALAAGIGEMELRREL